MVHKSEPIENPRHKVSGRLFDVEEVTGSNPVPRTI
ncbi:MAG: hypothetical protein HW405_908 [Candidatus Berkelbacteria bacterium]|nr:hypothetical protein [Candidatus Berkelbacteria bacterium]